MTARDAAPTPEGVVLGAEERLTDAEHNENGELAGRINWDRTVFTEEAVLRIVATRLAAERAAHEGMGGLPRLLQVASEDDMYELLSALNVSGESPEAACTWRGMHFLATLQGPDADAVHYIHSDPDTGTEHCHQCTFEDLRPLPRDCWHCTWVPEYPVTAVLAVEPDAERAREDGFDTWWALAAGVRGE